MSQSWSITLSDVVSMFKFGWSFHEIVYKRRLGPRKTDSSRHNDGRWGWKRLPIRAQASLDRWVFDDHGIVQGMVQRAAPNYNQIFIPIERSLLFRTESSLNNPEGRSILRTAYRSWFLKKNIQEVEAIGIERDLAGLPVVRISREIMTSTAPNDVETVQHFKDMLNGIRRGEEDGVMLPIEYDDSGNPLIEFELLRSGGTRQINTSEIVRRYDQDIAQSVLADFVRLGHDRSRFLCIGAGKDESVRHCPGDLAAELSPTCSTATRSRASFVSTGCRKTICQHWTTLRSSRSN